MLAWLLVCACALCCLAEFVSSASALLVCCLSSCVLHRLVAVFVMP